MTVAGVTQVLMEQLVVKVNVVTLEQQVFRGRQDHQEPRAREVKMDSLELPDNRESQVRLDSQGLPDLRDSRDQMDSQVFLDSLAYLDWRVRGVQKDRLVHKVHRVHLGHQVPLVQLVTQATVVHLGRTAPLVNLELWVNRVFLEWQVQMVRQVTGAVMALEVLLVTKVLKVTLAGLE